MRSVIGKRKGCAPAGVNTSAKTDFGLAFLLAVPKICSLDYEFSRDRIDPHNRFTGLGRSEQEEAGDRRRGFGGRDCSLRHLSVAPQRSRGGGQRCFAQS